MISQRILSHYLNKSVHKPLSEFDSLEESDLGIRDVELQANDRNLHKVDNTINLSHESVHTIQQLELENGHQPTATDSYNLLYINESPDYCQTHQRLKYFGTSGRQCSNRSDRYSNENSSVLYGRIVDSGGFNNTELASCKYLCCNRGFRTEYELELRQCECRFEFCCRINCKSCLRQRTKQYCI